MNVSNEFQTYSVTDVLHEALDVFDMTGVSMEAAQATAHSLIHHAAICSQTPDGLITWLAARRQELTEAAAGLQDLIQQLYCITAVQSGEASA